MGSNDRVMDIAFMIMSALRNRELNCVRNISVNYCRELSSGSCRVLRGELENFDLKGLIGMQIQALFMPMHAIVVLVIRIDPVEFVERM